MIHLCRYGLSACCCLFVFLLTFLAYDGGHLDVKGEDERSITYCLEGVVIVGGLHALHIRVANLDLQVVNNAPTQRKKKTGKKRKRMVSVVLCR